MKDNTKEYILAIIEIHCYAPKSVHVYKNSLIFQQTEYIPKIFTILSISSISVDFPLFQIYNLKFSKMPPYK